MTVDTAAVSMSPAFRPAAEQALALSMATVKYADNVRYAPPPGFVGQDTVTFTAFDSFGNSAAWSVIINV